MKVQITYIVHSSFLVRVDDDVLLFDWSELGVEARDTRRLVTDRLRPGDRLFVLNSHGHGDHFSPEVVQFADHVRETHFVFGHDIVAAHPEIRPPSLAVAEPDGSVTIGGLDIQTPRANDCNNQSVSFLLEFHGLHIWFGADMAWWDWPQMNAMERKAEEDFFHNQVSQLEKHPLDLAFVNADARLDNWGGGIAFARRLKPRLFIPMHTFGQEETLDRFVAELGPFSGNLFHYRDSGDSIEQEM